MSILAIIGCGVAAFVVLVFGRGVYYGSLAKKYHHDIDTLAAVLIQQHLLGAITKEEVASKMNEGLILLFNGHHNGYREAIVNEVVKRIEQAQEIHKALMAMAKKFEEAMAKAESEN